MKTSILTSSEVEWLTGKKKVSKAYEYRIRSDIKKKIQIFQHLELPLLVQNGFLDELSVFTQLSANTQILPSIEQTKSMEKDPIQNITSDTPESRSSIKNNTYKNNNIDNVLGAGGLAWLGYRLDMAGLTCSNHVRPIFYT